MYDRLLQKQMFIRKTRPTKGSVVDPKNWTLPVGVEFSRKEV